MRNSVIGIIILSLVVSNLLTFAEEEAWITDFNKALSLAKKENKDLLVFFTGSDWCSWCLKLDKQVFSQPTFLEEAKKNFVLVKVDNPKKGPTPEATALINKYAIHAFPTVVLMFNNGAPYAKTGYLEGGPENYLKHLDELVMKQRKVISELLKKADISSGEEQEKACFEVFLKCQVLGLPVTWVPYGEKLLKADPENKKGYFLKVGPSLAESYILAQEKARAQELLEALVKLTPKDDHRPYYYLASLYFEIYRWQEAVDLFNKALEIIHPDRSPQEWLFARSRKAACLFNLYKFDLAREEYEIILKSTAVAQIMTAQQKAQFQYMIDACLQYQEFWKEEQEIRQKEAQADNNPLVELKTTKGTIILELFEDYAPNTVANFISLVQKKFYDGTLFHRVIPNFMIQGGDPLSKDDDPTNDGTGGPGYTFDDELSGEYRKHFVGSLSMANSGPNTNGSQFFITHCPTPWLNGKHTVFGRVKEGQEVVNSIQKGDKIISAKILRKRQHRYQPKVNPK